MNENDLIQKGSFILKRAIEEKSKVLIEVARQVLKREPTEQDAKDFTLVTNGSDVEAFMYKTILLGTIEYVTNKAVHEYKMPYWKFTPSKTFNDQV